MTTPILKITEAANGQVDQYLTYNEALRALESSTNNFYVVDMSSGDVTLTDAANTNPALNYIFSRNQVFRTTGNTVARVLTVPQTKRLFVVQNGGTFALTVKRGTTEVSINAGISAIFYCDGTANGLSAVSAGSGGGGGVASIATIADLEALDGVAVGQRFSVTGYLAGTLGGGDFVAIPGSDARDGVKTFVSANGVRIQRTNIETVTPYHAGWDGTDDAHTYVQACLDHYNDVYCPSGTYTVLFNAIKIQRNGVTLRGDGESTIFVNKAGQTISVAGGVLKIAGTESTPISGSVIRKVTVDYNRDNVTHTLDPRDNECISVVWGDSCEVSECRTVNGISEGIDIDHTINSRIVLNECTNNNGHGIHISSGTSQCVIMGNRCWDNGWTTFRSGMDCYEGFDLGGPNEIPAASDNIYIGNDCYDNYINYRILGPRNVFDANKDHGTTGGLSSLSGAVGGVRAISSGDGERAKTIWQAKTSDDQIASFTEVLNPDGNSRFKLGYRRATSGVESFIIASNTDNVLFEVFAGTGFATFSSAYTPESGSLSSATYQNSTGYYVRLGKSVTFQLRLSLSEVSVGTAAGKLTITGLPVGPQVDTAASVNAMRNWDFASPPSAINARVRQSGDIELEIFNPNATTQEYVTAADLKTGSGSFLNQVYISGSFVTG